MNFNKTKYVVNMTTQSRTIEIGTTTTLDFLITEVFKGLKEFTAEIAIDSGTSRSQTQVLPFTVLSGEAPNFTYTSDFAGITAGEGSIRIKITEDGNSYLVDETIAIEFIE